MRNGHEDSIRFPGCSTASLREPKYYNPAPASWCRDVQSWGGDILETERQERIAELAIAYDLLTSAEVSPFDE